MPAYSRVTGRPVAVYLVHVIVSLALLGPSGCFDPDTTPLDGGEASTGVVSTTSGPEPSSSDGGSTSSVTSSSGPADSSSGAVTGLDTGTDSTSTGEPVVGSSSGGESSSSGGESSTGEPPPPTDGYGDCENNPPAVACLPGEQCIDFGNIAFCAEQGCVAPGDCTVPATGNPNVSCTDLDGNGSSDCYLECSAGQTCPDGMVCYAAAYCMWTTFLPPGVCPDQNLGNAVPQSIMGDNTGLGDDHYTSCGNGGGEDATYQFTAPFAGTYVFDTFGTAYDTILAVLGSCGGAELGCNDDAMGLQSQVTLPLAAGQTVIIVVDGYSGGTGPFTLNITAM